MTFKAYYNDYRFIFKNFSCVNLFHSLMFITKDLYNLMILWRFTRKKDKVKYMDKMIKLLLMLIQL